MHMYNMSEACCNINVVRPQMHGLSWRIKGLYWDTHHGSLSGVLYDVPCFQYTSLAVVQMEVNHFCFFFMHLVKCMLCYL